MERNYSTNCPQMNPYRRETLHICSVGKSPFRLFKWSHFERIHTGAMSGIWNVGKAFQAMENAGSMCRLRSREENPRMQVVSERFWKVITLIPPGLEGLTL